MGQVVEKKNQYMPDIASVIISFSTDEDTKAKRGQWTSYGHTYRAGIQTPVCLSQKSSPSHHHTHLLIIS